MTLNPVGFSRAPQYDHRWHATDGRQQSPQGCEAGATLGYRPTTFFNRNAVAAYAPRTPAIASIGGEKK